VTKKKHAVEAWDMAQAQVLFVVPPFSVRFKLTVCAGTVCCDKSGDGDNTCCQPTDICCASPGSQSWCCPQGSTCGYAGDCKSNNLFKQ